ncbi:transglycosylase domain-containing protein [Actinomycetospora termitidis]|uniref:Transglycosylase domain-containing protein n=1 Tax=Actinomycetospora termitidis TaxID=3053470 RepID=A0ABT7MET4_9PSEU|nr:transglycosylase domain-containing protein [Actinomycetospora sp. Odt1-22]MDL5159169.1 transglycosylase domain-containing protein [Actinomycetospora sp. Odt1-22]
MTSKVRLLAVTVIAGILVAGAAFPLVGGLGLLSNQAIEGAQDTAPGVLAGDMPSITTVTDMNGAPIAYLYDQNRQIVRSEQISVTMKAAIVAIEDRRFFSESGLDPRSIARALVNNGTGGSTQGASTLTEQYVKNYDEYVAAKTPAEQLKATEATFGRKLREARVAEQLDHSLSKDEILTRYLNVVYLGNQSYGVAAAARTYFNTTPDQLTVPQAALLAGMVQSPAAYDPVAHPQAATGRRNVVIDQMRQQGELSPEQAAAAAASPLGVQAPLHGIANGCTGAGDDGFFCSYVLDYLDQAGITPEQLRSGGYTVRTTLDPAAMAAAKQAVDAQVPPTQPHVADTLAVVQPGTTSHPVRALVANRGYGLDAAAGQTTYDLPAEPENLGAGSVYKIFTSAAYLAGGGGISNVIPVPPNGYASPLTPGFVVSNDGNYPGALTLQDALAQSPNTAFVKLEETTGIAPVVDMAVQMGMTSLAKPGANGSASVADTVKAQNQASFTLGVAPTSPLELASVGATLASHGTWCPPDPIQSVTDSSGAPVSIPTTACHQAVPPQLADTLMTGMSKDDQPGGTSAAAATAAGWNRPTAAKTGTTQVSESGAFVAATPQMSGASIVFDDSSRPRPICNGSPPTTCSTGNLFGGNTPAQTYYQAMTTILGGQPVLPLPPTDPRFVAGGDRLAVPQEVGQPVDQAAAALRAAGFAVTTSQVDNRSPAGTVVGQTPSGGGGQAVQGQTIALVSSSGHVAAPPAAPSG